MILFFGAIGSRDNDVTMLLALNLISALFGTFFAFRYIFFGYLSSAV